MIFKGITDKKNHLNNCSYKQNLLEIKQNLFNELTTQSSRKVKFKDNEEYSNKYINFLKSRSNEENTIQDYTTNYRNNVANNRYILVKKRNNKKYNIKSQSLKNKTLTVIKSQSNFDKTEDDLMFIITKDPSRSKKKNKENNNYNTINDDNVNIISHLALPFCRYHKYNLKLPKKYTCNFKKCSCCEFKDRQSILDSENTKETSRDYIYPSIEKTNRSNKKYKSVLEKFIKKNNNEKRIIFKETEEDNNNKRDKQYIKKRVDNFHIKNREKNKEHQIKKIENINIRQINYKKEQQIKLNNSNNKSSSSIEEDNMSNISFNFKKPDETNLKIPKKNYDDLSDSFSKSFSLEIPEEINIKDENYLKEYKNKVNENNKKSKKHFSVTYYQKLNKSYQIYHNENKKDNSLYKAKNKEKNIEFLRYE